jgi:predicted dehydrogenase
MLEETYGHSPVRKMFDQGDVYGVGYDADRAARKPLRLAIIGAGGVAVSKHIPAILRLRTIWEPVELVAAVRTNPRAGRHIESTFGCRWYSDVEKMLAAERPDGVIVSGPDDLHVEHSLACIEKDIPVLVEKPISRSLPDASRLCRTAEQRKVPLMTVSNKRYSAPYRRAKRFVADGPVKNPAMLVAKFNLGYAYVDLLEQGTVHVFDLVRYFMGDVRSVHAVGADYFGRNKTGYPFDNAIVTLSFASGAIGCVYTSSTALSLKPWERVELYGDKAWLTVEDQCELILYDSEEGPTKSWRPVVPNTLLFDEEFGGFMGLIENFCQVIRGVDEPLVTGWDGYRALELCQATRLAVEKNTRIELPLPV